MIFWVNIRKCHMFFGYPKIGRSAEISAPMGKFVIWDFLKKTILPGLTSKIKIYHPDGRIGQNVEENGGQKSDSGFSEKTFFEVHNFWPRY